jgi:hypothetical protein
MKIDFEGFNKPGANATQKTAATEQPNELTAAEELAKAQQPYKKDQPAELLTPRGIAIQTDQVRRTIDETVDAKNEQLKAVAAEVLSEKSQGKTDDIKSAVAETINAVMEKFLPAFERLSAPRPAEIAALAKEAADKERNKREWVAEKYQLDQTKLAQKAAQARCLHLDSNGHSRLQICHNQPSRLPLAWCNSCQLRIEGKHYMVLPKAYDSSPEKAAAYIKVLVAEGDIVGGTPFFDQTGGYILCDEHPLYHLVRALENQASMGIV